MDDNELITKEELKKFKEIARKDYGTELTDEQAYEQAAALITFFEAVMKDLMRQKRAQLAKNLKK